MTEAAERSEWLRVAESSALESGRLHLQVAGRYVSILRIADTLHCLDSICYHTGGPLTLGDIEDVNGETCIRCPWHDYSVRLSDGAKPYQSMKFDPVTRKLTPDGWKYTRHTQRTHEVKDEDGLWVRLSSAGKFESDHFAYNESAAKNVAKGDRSFAPDGKSPGTGPGYKRSGEVLAQSRKAPMAPPPPPAPAAGLEPAVWRGFKLMSKTQMTTSMWLFRFALPECWTREVLRHVRLRLGSMEREYTPVSPLRRAGSLDLAVKIYEKGALTSQLVKMAPGQLVEMCGPHGDMTISWAARTITRPGHLHHFQRLAFLVAGSGVTPCIQILQDWVAQGPACASLGIEILYANRTEDEIAFRTELEELAKRFPNLSLLLAVSRPSEGWTGSGRLGCAQLQRLRDSLVIVCGPPDFNEAMRAHLKDLQLEMICL